VGAQSHPAVCRANGLVAVAISGATFRTIGGASHFMISTHPGQVADLIAGNVMSAQPDGGRPAGLVTPADGQAEPACCR
jgi:hypothetical protein